MKKLLLLSATASILVSPFAFAADNTTNTMQPVHPTPHSVMNNSNNSEGMNNVTADQDKWWHDKDINNDGKVTRNEYVQSEVRNGKTQAQAQADFDKKDKDKKGYFERSDIAAWFEKMGDKVDNAVK